MVLQYLGGLGLLSGRVADHGGGQEVGGDGPAVGLVYPAGHLLSKLLKHPPGPVRSVAEQQARPVDGEAGEGQLHDGLLHLALGAGVEQPGAGTGALAGQQVEVTAVVGVEDPGRAEDVVVVHLDEPLRPGHGPGGAQTAEGGVDSTEG